MSTLYFKRSESPSDDDQVQLGSEFNQATYSLLEKPPSSDQSGTSTEQAANGRGSDDGSPSMRRKLANRIRRRKRHSQSENDIAEEAAVAEDYFEAVDSPTCVETTLNCNYSEPDFSHRVEYRVNAPASLSFSDLRSSESDPVLDLRMAAGADAEELNQSPRDRVVSYLEQHQKTILFVLLLIATMSNILPGLLCGLMWGFWLAKIYYATFGIAQPVNDSPATLARLEQCRRASMVSNHMVGVSESSPTTTERMEGDWVNLELGIPPPLNIVGLTFKGWLNMLPTLYDPKTYHVGKTQTVFIRLVENTLRMHWPKQHVYKHAIWSEILHESQFSKQHMYNIAGCRVVLRPERLARRRWWSRKYPIVVESAAVVSFGRDSDFGEDSDNESGLLRQALLNRSFNKRKKRTLAPEGHKDLYFFARSTREKEYWFKRLRLAAAYHEQLRRNDSFHSSSSSIIRGVPRAATADVPLSDVHSRASSLDSTDSAPLQTEESNHGIYGDSLEPGFRPRCYSETKPKAASVGPLDDTAAYWRTGNDLHLALLEFFKHFLDLELCQATVLTGGGGKSFSCQLAAMKTLQPERASSSSDLGSIGRGKGGEDKQTSILWANALASRFFWDWMCNNIMIENLRSRIQRKLSTIRLPYFIETLTVTKLHPGQMLPRIIGVSQPCLNEFGLWVDFKVQYSGGIKMDLETKVNLMKLKTEPHKSSTFGPSSTYSDSDVPESPESSDEDAPSVLPSIFKKEEEKKLEPSRSEKLLSFVDKVASSKYFQEATDIKFVQKVMQGISDTPLALTVELRHLDGDLALNIPPPPSSRLWYGFRPLPQFSLRVLPRVGDKTVTIQPVTEWIENKLKQLFEKALVLPNMDDLMVPLMTDATVLQTFNS